MDLNISRFHRADRPGDFPDYVYFTIGTWAAGMRLHGFAGRVERVVKESSHRLEFCGEILDDMELQLESETGEKNLRSGQENGRKEDAN